MTVKFNEEELYLLKRWEDVIKFREALKKLDSTYQDLIEEKIKEECDWWNENEFKIIFYRENNFLQVIIYKKSWKCGRDEENEKWDFIGFGLENIDFDSIIGYGDYDPLAYIWTEKVKKLGFDLDKFNATLSDEIRDIFPSEIEKWGKNSIGYYLPKRKELKDALNRGEIIDIFIEHFNTLGKCIKPIDRTIERYSRR